MQAVLSVDYGLEGPSRVMEGGIMLLALQRLACTREGLKSHSFSDQKRWKELLAQKVVRSGFEPVATVCAWDLFLIFFVPTMSRSRVLGQFQEKARPSATPSDFSQQSSGEKSGLRSDCSCKGSCCLLAARHIQGRCETKAKR